MSEVNVNEEYEPSRKERIVQHLKEHKTTYIFGAVGVVAGVAVGVSLRSPKTPEINVPIVNNNTPSMSNTVNNVVNNMGGYSTKLVECLETGQVWKSVKDAAEAVGVSASTMSKHLNGRTDHIDGLVYSIIGFGSTGS